ncbi:MAG: DEAD/DEAH box helicase [Lachnospiraceae bacterium]|nr:DEAD/DEAH box helicase [Lachnospiraceae bacterium]
MSTTQQEINDMEQKMRFEDADIDGGILRAVQEMGFETMSPIQEKAIPVLLEGRDIIGQAQTGTGKTAAFGIPMIQNTDPYLKKLQGIVLCPTRELAVQAAEEIRRLAKYTHGIKVLPVYGGQEISRQIRALSQGVQIVVGTPGRVMDHMRRHTIKTEDIRMIVLDEADEMLNMGFREDIETILADMPQEHQMALFSATMPKPILDITHEYQKDAEYIRVTPEEITVTSIKQAYYRIARKDKMEALCRLLDYYQPSRSLIFCNTKKMVDEMAEILKDRDYQAEGLHGDLSQHQRDMVMNAFRNGRCAILIATDVAARGIDVSGVDAVFNYDVPEDIEYYVHRIGRTGRAGKKGRSFTLVCGREIYKIRDIERVCHTEIRERKLPSPKDITRVKSGKVFAEAMEVMEQKNLESLKEAIIKCAEENGFTVLDLAAAFMQMKVGDEPEEIREEKGLFERRRGSEGSRGRRRRRGEEGSRDGRRREEGSRDRRNRTESGREERSRHRDKDEPRREERRRRERGQEGRNREERRESLRREWERENGHRRDRDRESARGEKKKAKSILSGVKLGKKS